jgi:hypothetical protein
MNKLALNSTNVCNIMEICLEYLKYSDSSLNMKIQEFMNKEKTNSPHTVDYNDIGNIAKRLKLAIVNDVFSGMINSKIGLRLLLTGLWDNKLHIIVYKRASE